MYNNLRNYNLYFFLLFIYMMWGAHAWFTWFFDDVQISRYLHLFIYLIGAIISYSYYKSEKIILDKSSPVLIGLSCLVVGNLISVDIGVTTIPQLLLHVFPLWVLVSDRIHAGSILDRLTKWLAIILVPGIILHIIFLIKGITPSFLIVYPNQPVYTFYNYGILLKGALYYEADGIRFQSVFLEPGYFGTLCSFLLFANRYNFSKWTSWVILLGVGLSLSLAGYVVTIVGYFLLLWSNGGKYKKIAIGISFVCAFGLFIPEYNEGNNMINKRIFERLTYDEEKGISGNNRVGSATDYYYERSFIDGYFLTGLGIEKINKINGTGVVEADYQNKIQGAGYKIFIVRYGLIAALFYFFAYLCIGIGTLNVMSKYMFAFLAIVVFTFIQAAYPFSWSWWIPYVLGNMSFQREV